MRRMTVVVAALATAGGGLAAGGADSGGTVTGARRSGVVSFVISGAVATIVLALGGVVLIQRTGRHEAIDERVLADRCHRPDAGRRPLGPAQRLRVEG